MKTSIVALLALFMTATLTLTASSFQTTHDDPPVMDCWRNEGDVNKEGIPPNASTTHDCKGLGGTCCYNQFGSYSLI